MMTMMMILVDDVSGQVNFFVICTEIDKISFFCCQLAGKTSHLFLFREALWLTTWNSISPLLSI